ncbi:integrase, catalytic region, zinc finger, CCHC-type containing protein [Tanacetum coccineum]
MEWKPTCKVFTSVRHRWLPTGRTFTINGTKCPMTKITSNPIVPPKETSQTPVINPNPEIKVYRRRTKFAKSLSFSDKPSILGPKPSNILEPNKNWGSSVSNSPSSSRVHYRFGNDQIAKIMGYGDYQIGNVIISRVYYVEGLGHNLFSVGQFCNSGPEVAFQKHTCFVCNLEGVDLLTGSRDTNLYTLLLDDMMRSSPICLLSKASKPSPGYGIEVRLSTTVRNIHTDNGTEFVNQTLKSYYEDVGISHQTSVAQAVATACYTQNRSLIRKRHNKTPYELLHDRKPDLEYLYVFDALCYPTNDSEDLGKLKLKADIGIFIGYAPAKKAYRIYNRRTHQIMETIHVDIDELTVMASKQRSSGPTLHETTSRTISSGLVQNPRLSTPYVPPTKNDWDFLFQPMFDEYFNPPPSVVSPLPAAPAPRPADPTGIPLSTSVEQDASATSTSSTTQET